MSRTSMLVSAAVLAAASLIMMISLLVSSALARAPTAPVTTSAAFPLPVEYCYAWHFGNNTGYDATGVQLRLAGVQTPTQVYTGTLNPFGDLDPSSGYDGGTDTYRFNFADGYASDADLVQLGLCANQSLLRLGNLATAAAWMSDTTPLVPAPLFAGIELSWQARDHVTVNIVNEQALTLTLESAVALQPEVLLPLEDLTPDIAAQLPFVAELITEPLTLPPLSAQAFVVPLTALNQPIVFEMQLSAEDDPFNSIHLLAQTMVPGWQVFLPVVMR